MGFGIWNRKWRAKAAWVLVLALVLSLTACAQPEEDPERAGELVVTDDFGREITVPEPRPEPRIISLAPSITEILFFLGVEDQVAAVTDHCNYPPEVEEYPSVGGFAEPSLEAIVEKEPDLVLASSMHQETVEQLDEMGIAALAFEAESVQSLWDNMTRIGTALGLPDVASERVEELQAEVELAISAVEDLPEEERPLVFFELWHDPLTTAGPGTYVHDVITLAGGENLAGDADKAWPEYSEEVIIERNPDIILRTATQHGEEAVAPEDIEERPGWDGIDAVQEDRVFLVDDDLMSRPSPRLVEILPQLVEFFYPDLEA